MAEVLITLGVIGIVAALTIPSLVTNISDRVRSEQVRTVKYKLTNATSEMNTLGLIHAYPTTMDFVNELQKYYKILSVCDSGHLRECWLYDAINLPASTGADLAELTGTSVNVSTLTTGKKLSALSIGTANTNTVGIITGDGTPMILVFSPECQLGEDNAHQLWSKVNGKPETNATTNCISAIFDINGAGSPNTLGKDVRTLNSLFGFRRFGATSISKTECEKEISKGYGITSCYYDDDYWAGAMKKCHDLGMTLPSMQTLANLAGAIYGRTDITARTSIMRDDYTDSLHPSTGNCEDYFRSVGSYRLSEGNVICTEAGKNIPTPASSAVFSLNQSGHLWSGEEFSDDKALLRTFYSYSTWVRQPRRGGAGWRALCVAE